MNEKTETKLHVSAPTWPRNCGGAMALLLETQGSQENTWHLQGGIEQKVPGKWTRWQGDKGEDEEEGKAGRLLCLRGSGKRNLFPPPPNCTHFISRDIQWNVCHLEGTFMSQCTTGLICKETKEAQNPSQANKCLVDTDITHSVSPKPK